MTKQLTLHDFCEEIINGHGGLHAYEDHEMAVPIGDREKEEAVNCGDGLSTTPAT